MERPVSVDLNQLAELCHRHGIRRIALFGSSLNGNWTPESDLDVLVEFVPGRTPGFGFIEIQDELSALTGIAVDLNTEASLSRYFRKEAIAESRTLYEAA